MKKKVTVELADTYLKINRKGRPVIKDGHAIIINKLSVLVDVVEDYETGEPMYAQSPDAIVHHLLNKYYIPVRLHNYICSICLACWESHDE